MPENVIVSNSKRNKTKKKYTGKQKFQMGKLSVCASHSGELTIGEIANMKMLSFYVSIALRATQNRRYRYKNANETK